ncbi:hypothetical protein AJ78_04349 [Emergomyces pasteurianus Ep9510]|uniref:Protein kinase domain-containing protein n=1 Tax=Emergomyces pasteurianus Ep9510 TaxID=1447872 RepID=A0A1J9Q587_9EURO|nr:hypothetical protein AJ78_04349 [Emergomyces pasteurianus Ep9510]
MLMSFIVPAHALDALLAISLILTELSGAMFASRSNSRWTTMQETFRHEQLPKLLMRFFVHRLFFSVNWLHATCGVVHTDISPMNVLSEMNNEDCLKDVEINERYIPSVSNIDVNGHAVYGPPSSR